MNQIKHHLTDALLMAYSAGSLPEAFNLVVATHISMCDDCRARAESFDAVGGALLEEIDDEVVSVGNDSFAATMALIKAGTSTPIAAPDRVSDPVLPAPLLDYVGGDLSAVNWKPVGMGVKQAILQTSPDASARLLFIPAGTAVPDHGHKGTELTLVLQGAFQDDADRFGRGDVEIADEDLHHTPVADPGQDCICLAATDAPLKFRGLIPKMAQPFLRL